MPSNLSLRILGDCDQGVITEFKFYPGEERTLKFQVYDVENDQRVCLPTGSGILTKVVTIPSILAADITKTGTDVVQDTACPSIFTVTLTETDTTNMMTGSLRFDWTVAGTAPNTIQRTAYKEFALKKLSY